MPLLLLASWLAIESVRNTQTDRDLVPSNLVKSFATTIDHHLDARIAALNVLATSPLLDDVSHWKDLYQEAQGFYQSFGSHVVLSDVGGSDAHAFQHACAFRHEAVPAAVETAKPAVGDTFFGPIAKEPLVAIAVPALREGKPAFLLLTIFETRQFQDRLDQVALPPGWSMALFDGRREIIAHRPPLEPKPDEKVETSGRFVAKSQVSPWSVVLEIPRNIYLAPLLSAVAALRAGILAATLASLLGGTLAGRRLGRSVAALAEPPAPDAPLPEVLEIAAVRRLLDEASEKRARAEATLRESEKRFRNLFEGHGPVMLLIEPESGALADANHAAAAFYGYSREQLRSIRINQINQLSPEEVATERQKAVEHLKTCFIFPHRLADGQAATFGAPMGRRHLPSG